MIRLLHGDCRVVMPDQGLVDCIIADPPYGETALHWDQRVDGWLDLARQTLKPEGSIWIFGSFRFFLESAAQFKDSGLRVAQDIVWEKHNGSSMKKDRFRRVHELAVQFYPVSANWNHVHHFTPRTNDAVERKVTRQNKPAHYKDIGAYNYVSTGCSGRLQRSVIKVPSAHGYAEHRTQKPEGIVAPLIEYSCPPGGTVGDWFAGSGTVGVCCAKMGRSYIGCELDPDFHAMALRRLGVVGDDLFVNSAA